MKTYFRSPELTNGYTLNGYMDYHPTQLKKEGIGMLITKDLLSDLNYYLVPIIKDNKIGFMNNYSEIIVEPKFKYFIGKFEDEDSLVSVETSQGWGILNTRGELIVPCTYSYACVFMKHYAILGEGHFQNSVYKVIDLLTFDEIIPYGKYKDIRCKGNSMTAKALEVRTNDSKWGLIDV